MFCPRRGEGIQIQTDEKEDSLGARLALSLVQDMLKRDVERANSLEIRIEKCSTGGKRPIIVTRDKKKVEEESDKFPLDSSFDYTIDESQF